MINVCYPFVGDSIGGSHISAVTLIKSIRETRPEIQPSVIVFCADKDFTAYLSKSNIPYYDIGLKLSKSSKIGIVLDVCRSFFKLIQLLRNERIDIVHTNDLRVNLIFLVACKFSSAKHLWHQRTSMPKSILGQRIFLLCDKFVTVSNFVSSQIRIRTQMKKVCRVYNPIDAYAATPEELTKRVDSFKKKPAVVAFIANITAQKNANVFVNIAQMAVSERLCDFEFVMIGRSNEAFRREIQSLRSRGELDDSFRMLGFREDIDECLTKVDFLIVPAEGDGFGRTLIESMRAGVVVLAYDSGGHAEIIEHNFSGVLVKNLNARCFLDSLIKIQKDKKLFESLLRNAHKHAISMYTVEQHTSELCDIYHSMLKDSEIHLRTG